LRSAWNGFLPPETDAQKSAGRRCLQAKTRDWRPPRARNGRKSGLRARRLRLWQTSCGYNRFPPKFWREKRPPDSRQRSRSGFRELRQVRLSSATAGVNCAHWGWGEC
jgi:hypothetical protein